MFYYALMPHLTENTAILTSGLGLPLNNWLNPFQWPVLPEPFQIEVKSQGRMLSFYNNPIPVMKASLLETIRKAGVDNIIDYEVVITDPFDGRVYNKYRAINIIGAIEAVDESLSDGEDLDESGSGLAGKFYDQIILDETKIHGQLMFRLAEKLSYIVVSGSIKDAMLAKENPEDFYFKPLFDEYDDD
jgi:hypothetical protein